MRELDNLFEEKIKNISADDLLVFIKQKIALLINDFDGNTDDIESISTRVCDLIYGNYRNLIIGQVIKVFEDISLGIIPIRKISVINIMGAFQQYKKYEVDKNISDLYKNEEPTFIGNFVAESGLPMGLALIHKVDLLITGEITDKQYFSPEFDLKIIAQKINNGEIKVHIKNKKNKFEDDMP